MQAIRMPVLALAGLLVMAMTAGAAADATVQVSTHARRSHDPYGGYNHRPIVRRDHGVVIQRRPQQVVVERTAAQRISPPSKVGVVTNPRTAAAVQVYGPAIERHRQQHHGHTADRHANITHHNGRDVYSNAYRGVYRDEPRFTQNRYRYDQHRYDHYRGRPFTARRQFHLKYHDRHFDHRLSYRYFTPPLRLHYYRGDRGFDKFDHRLRLDRHRFGHYSFPRHHLHRRHHWHDTHRFHGFHYRHRPYLHHRFHSGAWLKYNDHHSGLHLHFRF